MKTLASLCIDTDALANLLALGCLQDAFGCIGCTADMCFRLPSAPAQLERSKWFGERWPRANRALASAAAQRLTSLPPPQNISMQDALNRIEGVHEGDAYILTATVERRDAMLLTGDGNMLRALHESGEKLGVCAALRGRVLIFPQVIGRLVETLSLSELEYRWRQVAPSVSSKRQKSLTVMFGSTSPTAETEFWKGYELEVGNVTDVTGIGWLYSF